MKASKLLLLITLMLLAAYLFSVWLNFDDRLASYAISHEKEFRASAEQGKAEAQYNLGMMYYFGKGAPQDRVTGYQWVILAADRGEKAAKDAMVELAKKISGDQISKAKAAAQAWSQAHKKQG